MTISLSFSPQVQGDLLIRAGSGATLHSVALNSLSRVFGGVTIGGEDHDGVLVTVRLGLDVSGRPATRALGLRVDVDIVVDASSNADAAIRWVAIGPIGQVGQVDIVTDGGTVGNVSVHRSPVSWADPSQLGGLRVRARGGGRIGTVDVEQIRAITARPHSEAVLVESTAMSQIEFVRVGGFILPAPGPNQTPIGMVISGSVRVFGAAGSAPAVHISGLSAVADGRVEVTGPATFVSVNTVPIAHGADINACNVQRLRPPFGTASHAFLSYRHPTRAVGYALRSALLVGC